ncbi:MAG: hypothetical protein ACOYWZ_10125 [Bacillota bacterium]
MSNKLGKPQFIISNYSLPSKTICSKMSIIHIGDKAVICPKLGLIDILFIGKGIGKDYDAFM